MKRVLKPVADPTPTARGRSTAFRVLAVVGVTVFAAKFSGSENWTTLHTPDSEFYLTLGAYGSEVTERSAFPYYFWTRLGVVGPRLLMTEVFGIWTGYAATRALLLLLLAAGAYVLVGRLLGNDLPAMAASIVITLSTVPLAFVGDPYVTGTALAGLSVLFAASAVAVRSAGHREPWLAAGAVGVIGVWLLMVNPYAALLGAASSASLASVLAWQARLRARILLGRAAIALAAAIICFAAWLLVGVRLFPGLEWIETTLFYARSLNPAEYASPNWDWIWTETSLLVPIVSSVVTVVVFLTNRRHEAAQAALALSLSTVLFSGAYVLLSPGPTLEASFYSAMLWPGSLLSLVLALGSLLRSPARQGELLLTCTLLAAALVLAGHWVRPLSSVQALLLAGAAVSGVAFVAARSRPPTSPPVLLAGLLILASFQVLQNGRPPEGGLLGRNPYSWAFVENRSQAIVEGDVAAQQFVLNSTSRSDSTLVWVEPGTFLTSPAAMQLWGPNTLSHGYEFTAFDQANLINAKPTAVVTYSFSTAAVDKFVTKLPGFTRNPHDCRSFPQFKISEPVVVCVLNP